MKLHCSTLIAALLMSLSVFLGELAKTEYKSQMKKRRARKTEQTSSEQVKTQESSTQESSTQELKTESITVI